ncbi:MAG: cytochrome c [Firmicutes bacterium]|nr:cytochrome c [Bacillota bacterium]
MVKKKYILTFSLLLLAVVWLTGCNGDGNTPANNPPADNKPTLTGAQLVDARCIECHTLDRLSSKLRDDQEWRQHADRMLDKSPELLTEEEYQLVVVYLQEINE